MANLDFYALADDQRDILRFLFDETDVVIYELSSEFECEVRCFSSLRELEAVFQLGVYNGASLQLWSPSVMEKPVPRRIELRYRGHTFRYAVEGTGLIQLYFNGVQDGIIHHTHYGHWNEARARAEQCADDCDWRALMRLSGRIQRHIRGKLASVKLCSRPVLHRAFAAVQQGANLSWGREVFQADSLDIRSNVT